jgi:GT2 family glycosyltransferase
MRISVVIVSYRTPDLTLRAARSAADANAAEILIVDNASNDGTLEALAAADVPRTRTIQSLQNLGFGAGANLGAAGASGGALVFLNSDATLEVETLSLLATGLAPGGGRMVLGPRLVSRDGSIQRSAGLLPGPLDLAVRSLGLHEVGRQVLRLPVVRNAIRHTRIFREYQTAEAAMIPTDTTMVSGACFAIGREAFEELGGFDERFFMYFEDADLCRRAAAAGIPIRYVPDAVVTHIGGASSSEDYHFGPLHARAMRQYLGKWYGPGGSAFALLILWIRALGMSLTLQGGARRAWRAWWAAVRDEDPRR